MHTSLSFSVSTLPAQHPCLHHDYSICHNNPIFLTVNRYGIDPGDPNPRFASCGA